MFTPVMIHANAKEYERPTNSLSDGKSEGRAGWKFLKALEDTPWWWTAGSPNNHPIEKEKHLNQTSMALASIFLFFRVNRGHGQSPKSWIKPSNMDQLDSVDWETKISKPLRLEITLIDGIFFQEKNFLPGTENPPENLSMFSVPVVKPKKKCTAMGHLGWRLARGEGIWGFIHNVDQDRPTRIYFSILK